MPVDYSRFFPNMPEGAYIDEWGVGRLKGEVEHFNKMFHPMESFISPEQVWNFPLPDVLADYRWEGFEEKIKALKDSGLVVVFYSIQIFEPAWYLRGMENMLADMLVDEDMAKACLERMAEIKIKVCEKAAKAGVDIIIYGDDVGTQKDMMMSPEIWRKWLKPLMEKAITTAKNINPDLLAYYHSDGVIYDIIPELIEIGVDILNPIQPECMNPVKIKELYGDKLSFWGTVGTQTTMPFGSPGEVEEKVKGNDRNSWKGWRLCHCTHTSFRTWRYHGKMLRRL